MLFGRSDKKFCSDQCRNAYHNRRQGGASQEVRRINRILKKNRSLLEKMVQSGRSSVSRNELAELDFHFGFFTSMETTRQGRIWYYCYDQGYSTLNGDRLLLVRRHARIG